ncbi:MAG TPA: tannase/feruloyl esterase family alpha/beta hydrolase [Acidimicrobiales bacterium]|nr:tannase/feruloyl esterase family alpha/beta hydrolase [Acidimicrobiales bacterium]
MGRSLRENRRPAAAVRRAVTAVGLLTAILVGSGVVQGGTAEARSTSIKPIHSCGELDGKTFHIPAAAAHVTSTASVAAANGHAGYCDVRGTIDPAVGFELKLPDTYAGRYLQYGCMGFCGVVYDPALPSCGPSQFGGDFAVASTDDGHRSLLTGFGPFFDTSFAANDQAARNDFNYRAPHVLAGASKRIIEAYYGAPPRHSYFNGCSTGGREGLLLAQRYPHDFDGIVAGDPANIAGPFYGIYLTWMVRANTDASGAPILTIDKLQPLHDSVIAACDGLDGLVDGQIDDPSACHFDPETVRCPAMTDQPTCLTPAQVEVVRKLYAGPSDASGHRLYPGGEPYGSERAWAGASVPINGQTVRPLPDNYLRYAAYPIGAPGSTVDTLPFTVDALNGLTPAGVDGNAMSLDLSDFRRPVAS